MPAVQRVGDQNTAGGVITNGDNTVLINGRAVATQDSSVGPHTPCGQRGQNIHCNAKTQTKNSTVLVNGVPVSLADDIDTCGHARSGGSPNVTVG